MVEAKMLTHSFTRRAVSDIMVSMTIYYNAICERDC